MSEMSELARRVELVEMRLSADQLLVHRSVSQLQRDVKEIGETQREHTAKLDEHTAKLDELGRMVHAIVRHLGIDDQGPSPS
ncbi:hypothetical protein [Streptomyces boncukensis]|uniref:Uncharacterized protein n=1 Tax=Streptomyces boncukensis TaxID=2711219 RepID=A0A6G4X6V7_9ACTN|nr:hypothetical protein [Streptomyces boncukensis]NGO72993.1 hypothetical protein [Streptomyces boncukensis]